MKFASLESVRTAAWDSFLRFPLALFSAWVAGALSARLVYLSGSHPALTGAIFSAALGIPLFMSITLLCERLQQPDGTRTPWPWVLQGIGLAALAAIAVLWPSWSGEVQTRRYFQLSLLVHALAAFLPYTVVREPNGFWQYNRTLFMRMIVVTVFSSVLLGGLNGALAALKPLFGIRVDGKVYFLVSIGIYFVFHPWVFLAGVPRDLSALERHTDYPPAIRIFAQFILVPIVALYQAILTAYLVRVIVTQQWPSGLIGWLVSAVATTGVLAILLIHPVRERQENRWVSVFSRWFYIVLVPSIVMLALSIGKRIGQYGVTEDRYFVVALCAWLAGITVYFIARRDGDIRWIPITLAGLALVTLAGPWGAYSISVASQKAQLTRLLREHHLLVDGEAQPASTDVPLEAQRRISSVLTYLLGTHGDAPVRAVLGKEVVPDTGAALLARGHAPARATEILMRLKLQYVGPWQSTESKFFTYAPYFQAFRAQAIAGFDYHVHVPSGVPFSFTAGGGSYELRLDPGRRALALMEGRDTVCVFPLDPVIERARLRGASAPDSVAMSVDAAAGGAPGKMLFQHLAGTDEDELTVHGLAGELYFGSRAPR